MGSRVLWSSIIDSIVSRIGVVGIIRGRGKGAAVFIYII